jgi:hypothetical protein
MCRIYVKRNEYQRFDDLYNAFRTSIPVADVLWDRRTRDRRSPGTVDVSVDRRRNDRRNLPPASWSVLGFVVAQLNDVSRKQAAVAFPRPRPVPPAPSLRTDGQVAPRAADLKGAVVRIAEGLVSEIVDKLNWPAVASPRAAGSAGSISSPPCKPVPSSMSTAPCGAAWKLVWPPLDQKA